jgi:hypothetical protein
MEFVWKPEQGSLSNLKLVSDDMMVNIPARLRAVSPALHPNQTSSDSLMLCD